MAELTVTAEDRATLERWTTRRKTAHGLAVRAEIVLRCSSGCSNSQVARELRMTNATVGKWRSRFVAEGVAGLLPKHPRPEAGVFAPLTPLTHVRRLQKIRNFIQRADEPVHEILAGIVLIL